MILLCHFTKTASGDKIRMQLAFLSESQGEGLLTTVEGIAGSQVFSGQASLEFFEEELAEWVQLLAPVRFHIPSSAVNMMVH